MTPEQKEEEPQQFYVYWDGNGSFHAGMNHLTSPSKDFWDNILKISLDDLIKHGEKIK